MLVSVFLLAQHAVFVVAVLGGEALVFLNIGLQFYFGMVGVYTAQVAAKAFI